MAKAKVFITRRIPEKGMHIVNERCQADVWGGKLPPSREELLEHVEGIEGLLCLLSDRIDEKVMDTAAPNLKVISNYAVGFDNIDIKAATKRGIPVGNTPGVLTDAVADFAFALLMAAARRVVEADQFTHAGKWKTWGPELLLGADIKGATLGIVGFGRIGRAVARRARGFDMKVLYYDPYYEESHGQQVIDARPATLDTILRESDFISIHTPLNEDTYHLFNREAFAKMKPTAILINTARGAVVDPEALYAALRSGRIACAALDVMEPEPIPLESPLLKLDNLIVTPHIASGSKTAREKMAVIAVENLLAGLNGKPLPHCVNEEVYKEE